MNQFHMRNQESSNYNLHARKTQEKGGVDLHWNLIRTFFDNIIVTKTLSFEYRKMIWPLKMNTGLWQELKVIEMILRGRETYKHKKLHKKCTVHGRHGWNIFSIVGFLSYMLDYFTSRSVGQTRTGSLYRSMSVSDSNDEILIIYISNDLCNFKVQLTRWTDWIQINTKSRYTYVGKSGEWRSRKAIHSMYLVSILPEKLVLHIPW